MLALGRLMTRELVEVVMLKLLPAVPVETLLMLLAEPKPKAEVAMEERFLLASAKTKLLAVRVEILTLPRVETEKKEAPEVEAMVKTGQVWAELEAWTTKEAVGVEEFMPWAWVVLIQTKLAELAVVLAP